MPGPSAAETRGGTDHRETLLPIRGAQAAGGRNQGKHSCQCGRTRTDPSAYLVAPGWDGQHQIGGYGQRTGQSQELLQWTSSNRRRSSELHDGP